VEIWDADDSTPSGKGSDSILDSFKNASRILSHYRGSAGVGIDFLWEPAAGHKYAAEIKRSVSNPRPGKRFPRTLRRPEGRKAVGHLPGAVLRSIRVPRPSPSLRWRGHLAASPLPQIENALPAFEIPLTSSAEVVLALPAVGEGRPPSTCLSHPPFPGRSIRPSVKAATPS
jgi:hypothetical protein